MITQQPYDNFYLPTIVIISVHDIEVYPDQTEVKTKEEENNKRQSNDRKVNE